ncbi:XIAP-associated factor 1 [Polypterus senegalus]|uniref:XIAP-associated factor 1 n=1 Tax=Polypterus senegalus TaxID=55291 RepID=UPI0019628ADB|nr:XIAP-associated factor 1 [Polypterus senegalus]
MEAEGETKICKNCKKEVAVTNFSLHIVHCHRFLSICPLCDESVPSDQLEEHRDREHRKVQCIQCRKKIENYKLEIHKLEECLQRMNICPFCDLEMPFCKLSEHKAACGSRTQLCPDCNKYIKLVDEEKHYDDCPAKQQQIEQEENEDVKKQDANMGVYSFADRGSGLEHSCWYCMKSIPAAEIKKHERDCRTFCSPSAGMFDDPRPHFGVHRSTKSPPFLPWSHEGLGMQENDNSDEIRACVNCHLALPTETLKWHEAKCLRYQGQDNLEPHGAQCDEKRSLEETI